LTFELFALDERIMAGVRDTGWTAPTPIQSKAIPAVLRGCDVMGLAQTGTGKTAAFVLPILHRLLLAKAGARGPLRVLVLSPTRELAVQTHETFTEMGRRAGIRCATVFGGVGQNPQVRALRQATVAVACPGRLLDLMNQGLADVSQVEVLVLDEADRMLDMGFAPDIKRILAKLTSRRQTLLFSATMPAEIRAMAADIMRDPVEVRAGNGEAAATVSHAVYPVSHHLKLGLLEALLREVRHESVLIFTRTKHHAKNLAAKLEHNGWSATSIQGNLSQNRRQEAMSGFKQGKYRIMVATDIAARGIDCASVSHVINYDLPDTAENYTHRIGRTGRAERLGMALTLASPEDRELLRMIERSLGRPMEQRRLESFDYTAPRAQGTQVSPPAPRGGRPMGNPGRRPSRPAERSYSGRR